MREKIENLFQRKQSYNSMHSLNTSMESTRGGCQRGASSPRPGRGDRVVEPGEAQQDGHSFPRDEVVRVMFMVGTAGAAASVFPGTVAPAIGGPAGAASGRGCWVSGGDGGGTCCPDGAVSG